MRTHPSQTHTHILRDVCACLCESRATQQHKQKKTFYMRWWHFRENVLCKYLQSFVISLVGSRRIACSTPTLSHTHAHVARGTHMARMAHIRQLRSVSARVCDVGGWPRDKRTIYSTCFQLPHSQRTCQGVLVCCCCCFWGVGGGLVMLLIPLPHKCC